MKHFTDSHFGVITAVTLENTYFTITNELGHSVKMTKKFPSWNSVYTQCLAFKDLNVPIDIRTNQWNNAWNTSEYFCKVFACAHS